MLTALSVVANGFSIKVSVGNYLSFTYIPCFIAAIWLGAAPATAVGFLGDLIAGFVFSKGAYNILIGIASALIAFIPSVVYKLMPNKRRLALIISLFLSVVICTCGLNTFALWQMYGAKSGKTFWAYLWARLPFQLANVILNGVLIAALQESRAVDKLFDKIAQQE